MKGLHILNVIHRDLKLSNILVHNGVLKIADLGFAKQLDRQVFKTDSYTLFSFQDEQDNTVLGSLGNMAPEIIEKKPYGMLADMFSIGVIYYQMLFGAFPFDVKSHQDFINDIRRSKL